MEKVITRNWGKPGSATIDGAIANGGYKAAEKAVKELDSKTIIETVKASGLRGRGGAGFPTGLKWSFVPQDTGKPIYLCVNADESEPGTFKDRFIMENDPHMLVEGIIIASKALNCHHAFIYIRGEFFQQTKIVKQAVKEAYAKGFLGKGIFGSDYELKVTVHNGFGAYICGEETGLINSLEGKKGQPRIKPPFPAVSGLYNCPTVVNNVESLCAVPWIINNGADAYKKTGTEKSPGTKLFSVSGHVNRPGVYEIPLGLPLTTFINDPAWAGGIWKGRKLKACIPGGSSVPVLTAPQCEGVNLDYESLAAAGTMLGSGGMIVMDETTDMVHMLKILAHFYAHESCGQCTPCRTGTHWAYEVMSRIDAGEGRMEDLDLLIRIADGMAGQTICVLADALAMPIKSFVPKFRAEFEAKIKRKAA